MTAIMQTLWSIRIRYWVVVLVSLVIAGLVVSSCGVQPDKNPRAIPPSQVPFDLLAPSTTQSVTSLPSATEPAVVFLMGPDRLVPVQRMVTSPMSLGVVLAALGQGPSDAEASQSLRTAISGPGGILGARIENGIAVISVSDTFFSAGVQDQIVALAQVVFTATAFPDVASVRIELKGSPVDAPKGDGSTTREPLKRSDYERVAPRP